jgi:hypothetical protein
MIVIEMPEVPDADDAGRGMDPVVRRNPPGLVPVMVPDILFDFLIGSQGITPCGSALSDHYCNGSNTCCSGPASSHVIDKGAAARAPPADRDGVLLSFSVINPNVRPEHILPFCTAGVLGGPAAVRAGRAFAHTIKSL